ncbi:MAG: M20/M25/M40 family metallo-hydrolase [Melioribacteraceae bacterium]|nr:MAG: M20/M25/M40 family metallo-hydrolase [Melioribacteraceae bacterium]
MTTITIKKTVLILLFSLLVFSQDHNFTLVKIDLADQAKLNYVESLNLPIYLQSQNDLITLVNDDKRNKLKAFDVRFVELDKTDSDNSYSLVVWKKNSAKRSLTNVVYETIEHSIVKDVPQSFLGIKGIRVINFDSQLPIYRNEKTIYNKANNEYLDQIIQPIVNSIDSNQVRYYIQSLEDFGTRFLGHPIRFEVADWIKNQFLAMGFEEVKLDTFYSRNGMLQTNVVATLPAQNETDEVIIFAGHHDSITYEIMEGDSTLPAPGADDNASGTTAVLETARTFMLNNFKPKVNIRFVTFAAEEHGPAGSGGEFEAQKSVDNNVNVRLMVNHDMIAYNPPEKQYVDVYVHPYRATEAYTDIALDNVNKYSGVIGTRGLLNKQTSDSYCFYERGIRAIYFEETTQIPTIHTDEDLLIYCDVGYAAEVIKGSAASLAHISLLPRMIDGLEVVDKGNGTSLLVKWNEYLEQDFDMFKIYVGTESGNYYTSYAITENQILLENLIEGELYFVGVSVVDKYGLESPLLERSNIPRSLPREPEVLYVEPNWFAINLAWNQNSEDDLLGYNIYRTAENEAEFVKLNGEVLITSDYIDNTVQSGVYYQYLIKAVDTDGNESISENIYTARAVTLDQGILLVDETADGNGGLFSPTDQMVDDFYKELLNSFSFQEFDLQTLGKVNLSDLGAYSTIIWYGDDKTDQNAKSFTQEISKYLNFGGNFIYSGYRPSKTFESITATSASFEQGDFLYDYFKVDSIGYSLLSRFRYAQSELTGYPGLSTDQLKTDINSQFHLAGIEVISPNSESESFYLFGSDYDDSTPQGSYNNKPVGVKYLSQNFNTVVFSFPLYYMEQESVKNLITKILTDDFSETTDINDEHEQIKYSFNLEQNYPNPFNPTTKIKFTLPTVGTTHELFLQTQLVVYDILGREIKTILNKPMRGGTYEIEFDAGSLSSGVYFYALSYGNNIKTRKMILLR